MKIAIVTPRLYVAGGVERASITAANYFSKNFQYLVTIVTKHSEESFYTRNKSIITISAKLTSSRFISTRIYNVIFWFFWLGKWLRKDAKEFDYIIANSIAVAIYLLFWQLLYGSKYRIVICEHISFQQAPSFWKILRRWLYPRASTVISLTTDDLEKYSTINDRAIHLPNPVDIPPYQKRNRDNLTVLNIGRLEHQKGQDMLLAAWRLVHTHHPSWNLLIVGEGSKRKELEGLILKYQLTDSVEIRKPTPNVSALYQSSAMFVLSSRYEGLPVTLLEAQAHGLPCISFNCPTGPSDILCNEKSGFLVKPNDIEELAQRICQIIETSHYDDFSKSAHSSAKRFETAQIMNRWRIFFEQNLDL